MAITAAAPFAGTRVFFTADCRSLLADWGVCSWTWILHFALSALARSGTQNMFNFHQLPCKIISQNWPFLGYPGCWWKISHMWFGSSFRRKFPFSQAWLTRNLARNHRQNMKKWTAWQTDVNTFRTRRFPPKLSQQNVNWHLKHTMPGFWDCWDATKRWSKKDHNAVWGWKLVETAGEAQEENRRNTFRCLPWLIWIKTTEVHHHSYYIDIL